MPDLPDIYAKEALLPASPSPPSTNPPPFPRRTHTLTLLLLIPTLLISLLLGILIGAHLPTTNTTETTHSGLPAPPGTIHQIWEHNLTFSQAPTPASEAAWDSIVPIGRGFIHHEELAPFVSNIAVFHQLHCLHAILVSYYRALDNQTSPLSPSPPPIPETDTETTAMPHVRHCFDYLRRSLMCAADTNLEELDAETRETNGWGREKVCRDYEGVVAWAERWRDSDEVGIVG